MSEHDFTPFRREPSTSKMKTRAFTDDELNRLRAMPCERVFEYLGIYYKKDPSFVARNGKSAMYHVACETYTGELVVTGPKFFSRHSKKGGCGAIDLTIFLEKITFKQALKRLEWLYGAT